MVTVNVSLSESLKDWVEAQAESGRYSSVSEYVRSLIHRDQERSNGLAQVQALITEGFDSGISTSSLDDVLAEARARTLATRRP